MVIDTTVKEGQAALGGLPKILQDFQAAPEDDHDLESQIPKLMSKGAIVLANIWGLASQEASQGGIARCPAVPVQVSAPDWFPLQ